MEDRYEQPEVLESYSADELSEEAAVCFVYDSRPPV